MSQSYQNLASDQICKVQNDKKLISFHDRLRAALPGSYAQIHAKGEFSENNHKVHSLIGVSIQDYSNGTGDRNIITRFHLSPEQVQFFLTRLTAGFQEFEWSISKIFGEPDQYGYSTAQQFSISRHARASDGREMKNPWRIQIINGRGIKVQNRNGGSYMQSGSFQMEKSAFILLTDMDLYLLLKRVDHKERVIGRYVVKHTGNTESHRDNERYPRPCHNRIEHPHDCLFRHVLIAGYHRE